jgi:membrane protease YdiL (CAAX protease family)
MKSIWSITEQLFTADWDHYVSSVVLIMLIIGFLLYQYSSEYLKRYFAKNSNSEETSSFWGYTTQRVTGLLTLGVIPGIIFHFLICKPLWYYGINIHNLSDSLLWIAIMGGVIIIMNAIFAGNRSNLQQYPQIRIKKWSIYLFTINSISWILYLFGYEFMFRGILLFSLYHAFGATFAIILSTTLYSLVHLPKGRKETIGSIPLGIILSLISIHTGSFFAAFIFHVIMALTNDYFSILYNKEMSIKAWKS